MARWIPPPSVIHILCTYRNCAQNLQDSPECKIKIIPLFHSQQKMVSPSSVTASFEGVLEHFWERPISWAALCCNAQARGASRGMLCSRSCSEVLTSAQHLHTENKPTSSSLEMWWGAQRTRWMYQQQPVMLRTRSAKFDTTWRSQGAGGSLPPCAAQPRTDRGTGKQPLMI